MREILDKIKPYIGTLKREFTLKVIRCFIVGMVFLCLTSIIGLGTRTAHQFFLKLGIMIIFGLLLRNIWITLFLWWTVFLFTYFKFNMGTMYLGSVFLGCLLYYLTKLSFRKEHITFFINGVLWLAFLNVGYMVIQVSGFDYIFSTAMNTTLGFKGYIENTQAAGFMGFKACAAMLVVMTMPLLLSRWNLTAKIACFGLFVPLYLAQSSIAILAAIVSILFVMWHKVSTIRIKGFRVPKWVVLGIIVGLLTTLGTLYIVKVDSPAGPRERASMWKMVMTDTVVHPITGFGLDSFRKVTKSKAHIYAMNYVKSKDPETGQTVEFFNYWDNPHNLIVSLAIEWGYIAIFLLLGLLRQYGVWFNRAIKNTNTIALAGFGIAFLIVSMAQFPMHLARMVVIIIPCLALFEITVRE